MVFFTLPRIVKTPLEALYPSVTVTNRMLPRVRLTYAMIVRYVVWLVVVVSMRVAYDPWPTVTWPTVAEPVFLTPKETTIVTKNITGCSASSLLFICEDRGKEVWIPQTSALMYPPPPRGYPPAEMVEREASASDEPSDLMFLLPLLILNGAFAYAGSRPKTRLPKPAPSPPVMCKAARRKQFAYLHSAKTGKAMRRGNRTNAPARCVMTANRGARGF